jgi:ubiquinone/menaquinone biosynthesis C-methylase UbiE
MNSHGYFNEVAEQWDKMRQGFFPETVRDSILAAACAKPGMKAADIGAGTGFVAEGLIRRGVQVVAVDFAHEMIRQMERKFQGNPLLECRLGEGESLPLADESVDVAAANMYLHHVDHPPAAIREMVRIIRPGGKCIITDLDEHNFAFLQTEQHDRWMGFNREQLKVWLEEAGLHQVRIDCIDTHCCASSSCRETIARISIFIASGEK